jgi:hypothetical protein
MAGLPRPPNRTQEGTVLAITHPLVSTHHLITVLITAAVSVGLTVGFMLAFSTATSIRPPAAPLSRADSTLCHDFANATPGSPGAFRLADEIANEGSC